MGSCTRGCIVGSGAEVGYTRLGWGMADVRASLPFDETHTVMFAAVNNRLGLAIADSGAYQTGGGYTACGIPFVWSANGNGNGNGIPFLFVSVKTNFKSSVKFPFPLAAACFRTP